MPRCHFRFQKTDDLLEAILHICSKTKATRNNLKENCTPSTLVNPPSSFKILCFAKPFWSTLQSSLQNSLFAAFHIAGTQKTIHRPFQNAFFSSLFAEAVHSLADVGNQVNLFGWDKGKTQFRFC